MSSTKHIALSPLCLNAASMKKYSIYFNPIYIVVSGRTAIGAQSMESSPSEEPGAAFNSEDPQSQSVEDKAAYSK